MLTDEQLLVLMERGDQLAFEAFVRRYHGPLYGFLERLLHDRQKAEDLVQETFLRLLRQLRQDKPPDHAKAWLYRVAHNLCRDYWRSTGYRTDSIVARELPERPDEAAEVVELYERQETRRELISALEQLPQSQREIVMLRFFQDMKLQEISQVLEMPLGTVKGHLYQALKKLQKKIGAGDSTGKEAVWHA